MVLVDIPRQTSPFKNLDGSLLVAHHETRSILVLWRRQHMSKSGTKGLQVIRITTSNHAYISISKMRTRFYFRNKSSTQIGRRRIQWITGRRKVDQIKAREGRPRTDGRSSVVVGIVICVLDRCRVATQPGRWPWVAEWGWACCWYEACKWSSDDQWTAGYKGLFRRVTWGASRARRPVPHGYNRGWCQPCMQGDYRGGNGRGRGWPSLLGTPVPIRVLTLVRLQSAGNDQGVAHRLVE